jgi:hypothetical protein
MATEQEKADLSRTRGTIAAGISDAGEKRRFIAAQGESEAKGQDKTSELSQDAFNKRNQLTVLGSMKRGGTAKKTGPYLLHAGEKVSPSQLRGGAKKLSPTSMKGSAMMGRNHNLDAKCEFKSGVQDGRKEDDGSPLVKTNRAAVPRKRNL